MSNAVINQELNKAEIAVIAKMLQVFDSKIKDRKDNYPSTEPRFYKWNGTWVLSQRMGENCRSLRKTLRGLEAKGIVVSKKETANNILWAIKEIEGYRQSKYTDYYECVLTKADLEPSI